MYIFSIKKRRENMNLKQAILMLVLFSQTAFAGGGGQTCVGENVEIEYGEITLKMEELGEGKVTGRTFMFDGHNGPLNPYNEEGDSLTTMDENLYIVKTLGPTEITDETIEVNRECYGPEMPPAERVSREFNVKVKIFPSIAPFKSFVTTLYCEHVYFGGHNCF
jgi:hypothetical protein